MFVIMNRFVRGNLLFFLFLLFLSCDKEIDGMYVSSLVGFETDTLYLEHGQYKRTLFSELTCSGQYYLSEGEIVFSNWVQKGELPIGKDTMTVSFQIRKNIFGMCKKIVFNPDGKGSYLRCRY